MDTTTVIREKIGEWLTKRMGYMTVAYLLQTPSYGQEITDLTNIKDGLCSTMENNEKIYELKTEPDLPVVSDEALDMYKQVKNMLPRHELITKNNYPPISALRGKKKFHEIVIIAEDFKNNYNELLNELEHLDEFCDIKYTALILISAFEDEPWNVANILLASIPNVKFGCVIYNNDKIITNADMFQNLY